MATTDLSLRALAIMTFGNSVKKEEFLAFLRPLTLTEYIQILTFLICIFNQSFLLNIGNLHEYFIWDMS